MVSFKLSPDPALLPRPADAERAHRGLEDLLNAAKQSDSKIDRILATYLSDDNGHALFSAILGNSPFLSREMLRDPDFIGELICRGPDATFEAVLSEMATLGRKAENAAILDAILRRAKRRVALVAAVADITGLWSLDSVTGHLSEFADSAVSIALGWHLGRAAADGVFSLSRGDEPERDSGIFILGMGKLGAGELNYSSDIDLIVLFDDDRIATDNPMGLQKALVRVTRNLMRSLNEPTKDGYVFRTDLRLRPDPSSTPPAITLRAAETYYESAGQNWERAAMIKARPIAGDLPLGQSFLDYLTPFVWRKNLDFAAIADIHSIKRQINAHRGGGDIAVAGHNIKLGRGGIREIEFFAQTQQLIWGGRDNSVRVPATCDALRALAAANHISDQVAEDLIGSYRFLRRVEHRLQMIGDQQTHTLPDTNEGLEAVAAFLSYPDAKTFADDLIHHMRIVERHYAHLFEEAPSLSGPGNLVFTGSEDDPDTLRTLEQLGYDDPKSVAAVVRGWHHGRYHAMRSTRARELLTELMPALLAAFAKTANAKAALMKFDEFLAGLPAGVQMFSLFYSNPQLIDLIAEIMGSAPRLAERLSRNPGLFDAVLSSGFFDPLPAGMELLADLETRLTRARDFQDVLDDCRRWTKDHVFQIGVQVLRNLADADEAGRAFSDLADANITALLHRVEDEFAERHGRFLDGGIAVLALGKLGGREMTVTSDLDLIFVYDSGAADESMEADKPLAPSVYFARLSQRVVNALTAPTAEGKLYEVDMRLRPSGNQGPVASSLDAFRAYHEDQAWTWEHMALTRARVIAGPERLAKSVEAIIRDTLTRPRNPENLLIDVFEMRARIDKEFGTDSLWNVKYVRGGLVDIEFLTQYLQLRHAATRSEILDTNTAGALRRLAESGILDLEIATALIEAVGLWGRIQNLLRLTLDASFDPVTAPADLKTALAKAGDVVDFAAIEAKLRSTASRVHEIFTDLIERPAAALKQSNQEKNP